jgi:hypothetical protein
MGKYSIFVTMGMMNELGVVEETVNFLLETKVL